MKTKRIIPLFFLILLGTYLSAQDNETDFREQLKFGLKAGLNYSNVYDAQGEEFRADGKFGLAAGGFLSIPISKYIGIQPEILFSQKGFKASGAILGFPYEITRTTNYLDIPLFFAFKPSEFFTVVGGPQFSYLLKQKDSFTSSFLNYEQEQEFANDNVRKNTLCVVLGADINISHVVVSGRVGWDIQNNSGDGDSSIPRYKNVWYQATVGYRF